MTKHVKSFMHDDSLKNISKGSVTTNVNDLILALEKFRAEYGDKARIALVFDDHEGEIHPYQFTDVHAGWYDYEEGDVCNIELVQ